MTREEGWTNHEILDWQHIATWGSAPMSMGQLAAQLKHGRSCSILAKIVLGAEGGTRTGRRMHATHLVGVEQAVPGDHPGSYHIVRIDYFLCQVKTYSDKAPIRCHPGEWKSRLIKGEG